MTLTARKVEKLKDPGKYSDQFGLYLNISKGGSKTWLFRYTLHGKRHELGLGGVQYLSLDEARAKAFDLQKLVKEGKDPRQQRIKMEMTFEKAARAVLDNLKPSWRSEDHAERWWRSLEIYVFPKLGHRPIQTIGTPDVLGVLSPVWTEKNDTAKRILQRLSQIFDWAKGAGHYEHENPVNGVRQALPPVRPKVKHMEALPWQDIQCFVKGLRERGGISSRALEFLILTATRSGETRLARWDEIEGDIWTIPASRFKTGKDHRIPLCKGAMHILEEVRGLDDKLIFPSPQRSKTGKTKELSDTVFKSLFLKMGYPDITAHGFRSTFRDWSSEFAKADREVAEISLSHSVGSKVERAYARSDLLDRRRKLMDSWDRFVHSETGEVREFVR